MSNNLSILISSKLDTDKSLKTINNQIEKIIQPKVNNVKLKVDIDTSIINDLKKVVDGFNNVKTAYKNLNPVIKQHEQIIKEENGTVKKQIEQTLKNGDIITRFQEIINKRTQAIKNHTSAVAVDQAMLNSYGKKMSETIKLNAELAKQSSRLVYGTKNNNISVNVDKNGNATSYQTKNNIQQSEKELELQNKKKEALAYQLNIYKQLAQIKLDNLKNASMSGESKAALEKWIADVNKLTVATPKLTQQLKQMDVNFRRVSSGIKSSTQETTSFGAAIGKTLGKIGMWAGTMSLFYAPFRGLKDAVSIIYSIDSQMTQLKRVMDEFTDFEGMLSRQTSLAKELGRSMTDVGESMIEFARMGNNESQTMDLSKVAVLAQNISELTPSESVNAITSAMISFNIEADRSITIVDKLNQIDNNFSVTTQQLAVGMQKAGATAKQFGVDLDTLLGYETAVMSATRETGSVVGNSLRTIFSRITTMDQAADALKSVGVSIKGLSGDVKPVQDILSELQAKWSSLTNEQQQNIGVTIAGRNQLNRFLALMSNWETGLAATEEAMHSQGSAVSENAKYMESLEAKTNIMKASWQELALTMGEAVINDSLIGLIKAGTGIANVFVSVIEKVGLLPIVLGMTGVAAYALSGNFRTLTVSMLTSLRAMVGLPPSAAAASAGIKGLTISLAGLKAGIRGVLAATGVGLVLTAIGFAAEWAINKLSGAKDEIQDTTEALTTLTDKLAASDRLKELSTEYTTLATKVTLTAEEKIRLSQIESELHSKYDLSLSALDEEGKAYNANSELIETKIELLQEEIRLKRESASLEFRSDENSIRSDIDKQKKAIDDAKTNVDELAEKYEKFKTLKESNQTISNADGSWDQFFSNGRILDPNRDAGEISTIGERIAKALSKANEKVTNQTNEYKKSINKAGQGLQGEFRNFIDEMESSGKKIEPVTRSIFDSLAQLDAENGLRLDTKQLQEFFTLLNKPSVKSIDDVNKVFEEKLPKSISGVGEQLKLIKDTFMKIEFGTVSDETTDGLNSMGEEADNAKDKVLSLADAMKALTNGLNGSDDQMIEFTKSVSDAKDDIDLLNKAQHELTENGYLSSKTIEEVNKKYTDFIKVTGLSKDAIYTFIKASKEEKNIVIQNEMDKTKTLIDETKKRIEAITDEMNAKMALLSVNSSDDLNAEKLGIKALQGYQKILTELQAKYGILSNTLNDFKTDTTKTKKENDKLTDSYSDTVEVLTELQNALKNVQKLQDEEENKRRRMRQSSKEYQDSIRKTIELKKEELSLLEKADPSQLVSTKVTTTTKTSDASPASNSISSSSNSPAINAMLSNALGLQGSFTYKQVSGKFKGTYEEFVKGATSDCSQFVQEMFDEFLNINLPRTAAEQAKKGVAVEKADLKSGDLVFFNTTGKDNSHVGIYTGNGKFIQMGNSGLKESDMNSSYWSGKYQGARRVAESSGTSAPSSSGKSSFKTGNTTIKTDGPTSSEIQSAAEKKEQDIQTLKNEISDEQVKILESIKLGFERQIEMQQDIIYASKRAQEKLDPNSAEWRKENEKQVNVKGNIQRIQHQAKTSLRSEMEAMGINSDDWDDVLKKLSSDWLDVQSEKFALLIQNFNSQIDSSKQRISDLDNLVEQSKNRMSKFDVGSPEYNKELNLQIELTKKQNKENENLKKSLETLANSTKLDAASKKQYKEMLDELNLKNYTSDIKDLNAELIASKATPLTKSIDDINHSLDVSKATLKGYREGTEEYNKELKKQLSLNSELIAATKKLKEYAETQSKNEELSTTVREEYKKQVKELTLSLYEYSDAIKDIRETYADNVIEKYKKMLQEQQKLRNAAYDKEKEAEDARHETRMSNLDEEMSKFEDVINAQTKSLDREVAGEDYADQLAKLQKEKSELDAKFSSKLLDDSLEAKLQRADLQKEIDAKTEEITKLQRDREVTIRKEGLSDQLEDRKSAIDKAKKLEDDQNKTILKGIEVNKKLNDDYYDGLLNDEQYFYSMKQNLMSEDTVKIQNELSIVQAAYDTFFKELEKNAAGYSTKIKENLKYSITLDKDYANNFPSPTNNDGSSGSSGGKIEAPVTPSKSQKQSDWETYLSNKQKAEQLKTEMKTLKADSAEYKNKQTQFNELKSANDALRAKYTDFPDKSYDELKNIKKYHTGGEVGIEGTSTKKWWEGFEVPAILKKGEVVLDKPRDFFKEITGNIISNLSGLGKMVTPSSSKMNSNTDRPNITIRIDKVEGTKEGANTVTDSIERMLKKNFKLGY